MPLLNLLLLMLGPQIFSPVATIGADSTPDDDRTRFEPETISNGNTFCVALDPDGKTMYLTRREVIDGVTRVNLMSARRTAAGWSDPEMLSVNSEQSDADAFISPDGSRLFFMSTRPRPGTTERNPVYDLWVSERIANGDWGEPKYLDPPINTPDAWEGFPVVAADGTLYFFSERTGGHGASDLYRARPEGDAYCPPENLGPVINSEHFDGLGYISPDEYILVFASDRPGGHGGLDLYLSYQEPGGWTPPLNLGPVINTADDELMPHVDLAGGRLFFTRFLENHQKHVHTVDLQQTSIEPHDPVKNSNPSWASDARRFVYDSKQLDVGTSDILLGSIAGTKPHNVTHHSAHDLRPDWRPGTEWIAFDSDRTGNRDIFAIRTVGTGLHALTTAAADDERPKWSPDGTQVIFATNRDGNVEVYRMDADGSNQINVSRHPAFDLGYAWSPDGRRILFESDRIGNRDLFVMNADGSNVVQLTDHPANDRMAHWSPDGATIAFASDRGDTESLDIYLMDADGTNQRPYFASVGNDWMPRFSPDGRLLLFVSRHARERHLYLVDVERFRVRPVTKTGDD